MGVSNSPKSGLAQAMRVADLGIRLVIACLVGAFAGYWLDGKLGLLDRFPLLTLIGFFLGLAAGMVALVRGVAASERQGQPDSGAPESGPPESGPPESGPPESGPKDRNTDCDDDG